MHEGNNLIFIHLPKAGGNTLHKILEREYGNLGERVYTIHRTAQQDAFKTLSETQRSSINVLKGHMHYGMHAYLKGECTYMTMLREPVDRFVSQFYYSKATGNEAVSRQIREETISLEQYITERLAPWAFNAQTRHLSGVQEYEKPCTEAMFQKALQHLNAEKMLVGLLEEFDKSLILFKDQLGWQYLPTYTKKNVNKQKKTTPLAPSTQALIAEANHFDMQLYKVAQQKFLEAYQTKKTQYDKEVRLLQQQNRFNAFKHSLKNVFRP